jgi:L-amino acid N-acyltransferase YncA
VADTPEQHLVTLRPATAGDAGMLVVLLQAAGADGMLGIDTATLDPAREAERLGALDLCQCCVLAASGDQGPVGFAMAVRGSGPALAHTAVVSVVVAPGCRRQGVGRLLLEGMTAWARAAQVRKLCASVYASNLGARALFTRAGYTTEGVRPRQLALRDTFDDEVWFGLWLSPDEGAAP